MLTPLTVFPGPVGRLTGMTELEVVAPANNPLSVQNTSDFKESKTVSSVDIKEYSNSEQSWWLRLQETDTRNLMGIVNSSPHTEKSSIWGEGLPDHAVESMLSTACIICQHTASTIGVSEGSIVILRQPTERKNATNDEVECIGLRVLVSSVAGVGHIILSSCVRQCLGAEVFEYVEVMPSSLPQNLNETKQLHLHPVDWDKVQTEAQPGKEMGKDANKPSRSLYISEQIHSLSGNLKSTLHEFFTAWVSSQLELQKCLSKSKKGWNEVLLHSGSVIHMLVACRGEASEPDIKKEFTFVVELSTALDSKHTSRGKPFLVSQSHIADHLVSGQVSIRVDHTYSIILKNEPTFPLVLDLLTSPPWLQHETENALSHVAPTLDSDVHINVPNYGNAEVLPAGIIVTGAKGSGKTSFVAGIAKIMRNGPRVQAAVCYVSLRELFGNHSPAGKGKAIQEFLLAEVGKCIRRAPAIMVLDDLEAVFSSRDDEDTPTVENMSSNLASWLLELLENIRSAGKDSHRCSDLFVFHL